MSNTLDFEYLSKIRTAFTLNAGKKTSNILEGDYRSLYRGRSMEFDELSPYIPGDNVRDIDWKSTSRTGEVLVRRYVAERKHYLLFITDTGKKMLGDTSQGESKAEIATLTMGTIAYLSDRAGADYTLLRARGKSFDAGLFRSGMQHLDALLNTCITSIGEEPVASVDRLLDFAVESIRKRKIIVLITDFEGLIHLNEELLRKVVLQDDLMVVNIDDAYLTDDKAFDTDAKRYADTYMVRSASLIQAERNGRKRILDQASYLFRRMGIGFVTIAKEEEMTERVLELFRRDNLLV